MDIYHTYRKSIHKKRSEDSLVVNQAMNVYGVFDGATPLNSFMNANGENGAYIASNIFKNYFENEFSTSMTLSKGIIQANQQLMEEMIKNQVDMKCPEEVWSTCVSVVKIEDQKLNFAQLGDCMILAEFQNGQIKCLTTDTVKDISQRAKLKREKDRQKGIQVHDESYYNVTKNQLIYNRSMANTPDGYSVANGSKEVEYYIHSDSLNFENLKSLLLISDGFFHPNLDLIQVFKKIKSIGLEAYAEQLEQEELENSWHSDDKSGILINF